MAKEDLRRVLIEYPDALRDLLTKYKGKTGRAYDFARDPEGLLSWLDISQRFARQFRLAIDSPNNADEVLSVVTRICDHFGSLIEDNGLNVLLYDKGKLRPERFAQLLFFGIADAFCAANNLDLSREPNAGRGPVDFKVSAGYRAKVSVEVKYTSNKNLAHGYETQLPVYDRAERTQNSVYLILRTTESEVGIGRVQALRQRALDGKTRAPNVMVFDARLKRSASKA